MIDDQKSKEKMNIEQKQDEIWDRQQKMDIELRKLMNLFDEK